MFKYDIGEWVLCYAKELCKVIGDIWIILNGTRGCTKIPTHPINSIRHAMGATFLSHPQPPAELDPQFIKHRNHLCSRNQAFSTPAGELVWKRPHDRYCTYSFASSFALAHSTDYCRHFYRLPGLRQTSHLKYTHPSCVTHQTRP